jgi:hypothetical protein
MLTKQHTSKTNTHTRKSKYSVSSKTGNQYGGDDELADKFIEKFENDINTTLSAKYRKRAVEDKALLNILYEYAYNACITFKDDERNKTDILKYIYIKATDINLENEYKNIVNDALNGVSLSDFNRKRNKKLRRMSHVKRLTGKHGPLNNIPEEHSSNLNSNTLTHTNTQSASNTNTTIRSSDYLSSNTNYVPSTRQSKHKLNFKKRPTSTNAKRESKHKRKSKKRHTKRESKPKSKRNNSNFVYPML